MINFSFHLFGPTPSCLPYTPYLPYDMKYMHYTLLRFCWYFDGVFEIFLFPFRCKIFTHRTTKRKYQSIYSIEKDSTILLTISTAVSSGKNIFKFYIEYIESSFLLWSWTVIWWLVLWKPIEFEIKIKKMDIRSFILFPLTKDHSVEDFSKFINYYRVSQK